VAIFFLSIYANPTHV